MPESLSLETVSIPGKRLYSCWLPGGPRMAPEDWSRDMQPRLLVQRQVDDATAEFVSSISMRNACIAFFDDRQSMHRSQIVQNVPKGSVHSRLQSALVMHAFNERVLGYLRLTSARPGAAHERRALGMCERRPLGLGIPVSQVSSIYHQLFHAVPMWRAFGADARATDATFVPLVFATAAIGRGKPANPRRWYGWEFSLRALTDASAGQIADAVWALLRAPCVCFDRFEARAVPFNPGAPAAASHLRRFRDLSLSNARAALARAPGPAGARGDVATRDILLVSRAAGRRAISNENELMGSLASLARLRRVVLEDIPMVEQARNAPPPPRAPLKPARNGAVLAPRARAISPPPPSPSPPPPVLLLLPVPTAAPCAQPFTRDARSASRLRWRSSRRARRWSPSTARRSRGSSSYLRKDGVRRQSRWPSQMRSAVSTRATRPGATPSACATSAPPPPSHGAAPVAQTAATTRRSATTSCYPAT